MRSCRWLSSEWNFSIWLVLRALLCDISVCFHLMVLPFPSATVALGCFSILKPLTGPLGRKLKALQSIRLPMANNTSLSSICFLPSGSGLCDQAGAVKGQSPERTAFNPQDFTSGLWICWQGSKQIHGWEERSCV